MVYDNLRGSAIKYLLMFRNLRSGWMGYVKCQGLTPKLREGRGGSVLSARDSRPNMLCAMRSALCCLLVCENLRLRAFV